MALELFEGWGVVVANLLDDEAEDEPCLGGEHPVLRKLRQYIIAQIVDVLGLWGDVLCGLYGMKKAVDKSLTLMEVTLVERRAVEVCATSLIDLLKMLSMHTGDSHTHATDIHDKTTVAVDANDVTFESCQVARGDAEEDAVASIIMERLKKETDTIGLRFVDAHEGSHLRIGYHSRLARTAVLAEIGMWKIPV